MDLGYIGEKFTWRGKRAGGMVLERLDRAVATNAWFSRFPGSKVQHLNTHSSDHKAIVIKLEGITPPPNRPFKFEQMWLREGGCGDTVTKAWGPPSQNSNMSRIAGKIHECGEKLTKWSHQSFGSIKHQVEKKSKLLAKAEVSAAIGKLDYEKVQRLRAEVNVLLDKESQMWQQRWLMEEEQREVPSSSDLSITKRVWKGVWGLRVPNRIKTLLWRAGLDALPSRANLKKRKIISDDICPNCKLDGETSLHALWSCSALSQVWSPQFSWLQKKSRNSMSMLEIIQCCQEHSDCSDLFASIISQIWTRRNKLRVGESVVPLAKIVGLATESLLEFQRAQPSSLSSPKPVSSSKWSPPPVGWVKINFDGATFGSKNLAGLGGVIRNDKGLILAAFTHTIPLPTSVEMVEVLAARSALSLAKELCLNKVQLEGDSEVIVNALSRGGMDSSSFGHIVKDINILSSDFLCVSFSHSRRLGNKLAHCLARSACNFAPFQVWMEEIPPEFVSVYNADLP
nr:putative ribonuclease h protein [Quercus suber]